MMDNNMNELKKTCQRIRSLMQYAVPLEQQEAALDLLHILEEDRTGLMVLEEFYTCLPEAQEDWIKEIRQVARHQGVFLLAALTSVDAYLYLVSSEGIQFHGSLREGSLDTELLDFFSFESAAAFQRLAQQTENFPEYQALQGNEDTCPACHAGTGEFHELGCPVELCPWCGGQLIHCNCRFDQLGQDALVDEQALLHFEDLLVHQGRLAYSPEQRPSYLNEGIELL
jgi:hypothetical protein